MAKKQTFADKVQKAKAAGHEHAEGELLLPVRVRSFVAVDGKMKITSKMVKIGKHNSTTVYGG